MRDSPSLVPKSVQCLRSYDRRAFAADAIAGVTVGLVALPLAMAFAIASGLAPEQGIYCAIVTGFLISALGGSSCQIGGPTGAFVVVVAGIVARFGIDGLFMCTMMAGAILIVLGITGLGTAVKFIPRPVVVGFTNGIAVLIASTQVRDFLGLRVTAVPGDFLGRLAVLGGHLDTISWTATGLALATVALILVTRRYVPRISGTVLALLVGTAVAWGAGLPIETIGTRFGGIPSGLPAFAVPAFRPDLLLVLLSPALTVAMLGAIESLLSAVVADRLSGDRHNPNAELLAQGVANVVSPLFGGLPATGALARTATNIRTGARTPVAGMIHAATLLAVLLFAAPLARHVPMAVLAGILAVVAYTMGEWRQIPELLRLTRPEVVVWLLTFALTVLADLTVAVEVGMVLSVLLFIRNVVQTTTVSRVTEDYVRDGYVHTLQDKEIPSYAAIYRIHGPFLFGATEKLAEIADHTAELPPIVVLRLRNMTALDTTGVQVFEELAQRLHDSGRTLILCGARSQPAALLERARFADRVGRENVCDNVRDALARARAVHEARLVSSTG
jgi:SulP family sulfate permease